MAIQKVAMLAQLPESHCGPQVEHKYVKQQWKQNAGLGCPKENMTDKSEVRYHEGSFAKALGSARMARWPRLNTADSSVPLRGKASGFGSPPLKLWA